MSTTWCGLPLTSMAGPEGGEDRTSPMQDSQVVGGGDSFRMKPTSRGMAVPLPRSRARMLHRGGLCRTCRRPGTGAKAADRSLWGISSGHDMEGTFWSVLGDVRRPFETAGKGRTAPPELPQCEELY